MTATFDPYHRWLGIPPKHQPPNHYRLLGIELFEADAEVIRDAAERQISHVRRYTLGNHASVAHNVLNELAAAKACLLNPRAKAAYDATLADQATSKPSLQLAKMPPPRIIVEASQPVTPAPLSPAPAKQDRRNTPQARDPRRPIRRANPYSATIASVLIVAALVLVGGMVVFLGSSRDSPPVATGRTNGPNEATRQIAVERISFCRGHESGIRSVAFSRDGRQMLTASNDTTVRLWDVETGRELYTFNGHRRNVTDVCFLDHNSWAVSSSDDRTLIVWDLANKTLLKQLSGSTADVISVAVSPTQNHIVSGGHDRIARIWDLRTWTQVQALAAHNWSIQSVAWSSDGRHILTGGGDSQVGCWNADTGDNLWLKRSDTNWIRVSFAPDGDTAISYSGAKLSVWHVETGSVVNAFEAAGTVQSAVFLPDGIRVVIFSPTRIQLWNAESTEIEAEIPVDTGLSGKPRVMGDNIILAASIHEDHLIEVRRVTIELR